MASQSSRIIHGRIGVQVLKSKSLRRTSRRLLRRRIMHRRIGVQEVLHSEVMKSKGLRNEVLCVSISNRRVLRMPIELIRQGIQGPGRHLA